FTAGTISMSAVLAPASYLSPQSVQTTLLATSSSLDISVPSPFAWIAQGATLDMPLPARVLSNGAPVSGSTVTFQVMQGSATLNPANATTNAKEKRAEHRVQTGCFGLSEVRVIYKEEGIRIDHWPLPRKVKALYM